VPHLLQCEHLDDDVSVGMGAVAQLPEHLQCQPVVLSRQQHLPKHGVDFVGEDVVSDLDSHESSG